MNVQGNVSGRLGVSQLSGPTVTCAPSVDCLLGVAAAAAADRLRQVCVASGKAVRDAPWQRCKTCKRAMITAELGARRCCPLCHSQLPQEAGKGRGPKQARIIEGAAA